MYPTLIIIVCAVDRSLNERAADEHARNASIIITNTSQGLPRKTIIGVMSLFSAFEITSGSESLKHDEVKPEGGNPPGHITERHVESSMSSFATITQEEV